MDTTRADRLSCYGYEQETTPNIDALARDGILFERCVSTANWTLPTHASILSGLFPRSHGAVSATEGGGVVRVNTGDPATSMKLSVTSLAEVLEEAGHRTGAVLANHWWLKREFGLSQGFEHFDTTWSRRRSTVSFPTRDAKEITDAALRWLKRGGRKRQGMGMKRSKGGAAATASSRPFFLFLNYLDPHTPYAPPAPYDTKFLPEGFSADVPALFTRYPSLVDSHMDLETPKEASARTLFQARYVGEIAFVDEQVGRLIDHLASTGELEKTIVVVVGDHGEAFGEHGFSGHRKDLHQTEVWVPLILRLPDRVRVGRHEPMVSQVDIMPTLLQLLDLPIPEEVEGRSLLEPGPRWIAAEDVDHREEVTWRQGLFHDHWAYLKGADQSDRLFHLRDDPGETANLATTESEKREEMELALRAWQSSGPDLGEATPVKLSSEEIERLRALGYLK